MEMGNGLLFSFIFFHDFPEKFTVDRKDIEFFEKIGSGQFGVNLIWVLKKYVKRY